MYGLFRCFVGSCVPGLHAFFGHVAEFLKVSASLGANRDGYLRIFSDVAVSLFSLYYMGGLLVVIPNPRMFIALVPLRLPGRTL